MERILPKSLHKHWDNPKGLIQVIIGPRQVGKTTAVQKLMDKCPFLIVSQKNIIEFMSTTSMHEVLELK